MNSPTPGRKILKRSISFGAHFVGHHQQFIYIWLRQLPLQRIEERDDVFQSIDPSSHVGSSSPGCHKLESLGLRTAVRNESTIKNPTNRRSFNEDRV
ncbi:hypothetical protein TNCV_454811 [Trichonephila clavipes]|nr:hypothetical protein TNCV_454811 [Trichonephila clavipes]